MKYKFPWLRFCFYTRFDTRWLPNDKKETRTMGHRAREISWRARVRRTCVISGGSRVEKYGVSGLNTCLARVPFPQKCFTRRRRGSCVRFHVRKSGKVSDEGAPQGLITLSFHRPFQRHRFLTCRQFLSIWRISFLLVVFFFRILLVKFPLMSLSWIFFIIEISCMIDTFLATRISSLRLTVHWFLSKNIFFVFFCLFIYSLVFHC